MQKAAIYARYSTDEQRATSIDDQVRRAREKAISLGFEVPDEYVFSDSAISGQEKSIVKRAGYKQFLTAWENGEFQAVFIDEVSRLARDNLSLALLQDRVEKSGVRLVSTDGVDSSIFGWQLHFGFRGVMASHAVRETGHRVVRAMIGQLERGFMIAAPPFGYRLQRAENDTGTHWVKHEQETLLVEDIFMRRRNGSSLATIALSLNERGIQSPRASRKNGSLRYWRPATVRQLLANTIYRGVFVWNGSPFSRAKAKKSNKELKTIDYPRPNLRIVDDDIWHDCNQPTALRVFRGGGKNIFSGLVTCGKCHSTLTVATGGSAPSLYCAQCSQAKRVGVPGREGRYVSANGVKAVLVHAMERLFSDDAIIEFKSVLRDRLNCGQAGRITELKQEIFRKERTVTRLLQLIAAAEFDDPILTKHYRCALAEKVILVAELDEVERGLLQLDKEAIERQLQVNPRSILPKLFENNLPTEKVRAMLHRLFPVITLTAKPSHFSTDFYIEVAPGLIFAEISETAVLDVRKIGLNLRVSAGAMRPTLWSVSELVNDSKN